MSALDKIRFSRQWLSTRWGWLVFCLLGYGTIVQLLLRPEDQRTHFRIFVSAGAHLFRGENPYGVLFENAPHGYYFYSIACGWFYGLFSFLPETFMLGLFSCLSVTVILLGLRAFLRAGAVDLDSQPANIAVVLIASEVMGAVLSNKLEILMTGIMLIATSFILRGRHVLVAGCLLGAMTQFKFQPAPTVGLLFLAMLGSRSVGPFLGGFVASFAALELAPYLFYSKKLMAHMRTTLSETLHEELARYANYHQLYTFVEKTLGTPLGFRTVLVMGAMIALLFAMIIPALRWKQSKERHSSPLPSGMSGQPHQAAEIILIAAALGGAYTVICSPMSQGNAYLIASALPLTLLALGASPIGRWHGFPWRSTLGVYWIFTSMLSSDLVPKFVQNFALEYSLKPLGSTFAALMLVFWFAAHHPDEKKR